MQCASWLPPRNSSHGFDAVRSTQHWSGNCLSSSTKSAGMEVARGNGNVHWTSHMMMIMMTMVMSIFG